MSIFNQSSDRKKRRWASFNYDHHMVWLFWTVLGCSGLGWCLAACVRTSLYSPKSSSEAYQFSEKYNDTTPSIDESQPLSPPSTEVKSHDHETTQVDTRKDDQQLIQVDRARWEQLEIEIWEHQNFCELRYAWKGTHGKLPLEVKPPCRLLRGRGDLRVHAYPKLNVAAVFVISGTPVAPEVAKVHDLQRYGDEGINCGSEAQGLLLDDKGLAISRDFARRLVVCPNLGFDSKLFLDFAEAGSR